MNFNKEKRIKKLNDVSFSNFKEFIKIKNILFSKFSLKKLLIKKNKSLGRSHGKIVS